MRIRGSLLAAAAWVGFGLAGAVLAGPCEAQAAAGAPACTPASIQALVAPSTRIQRAEPVAAKPGVPAHCAVVGYVEHDGRIGFLLGLPETWNQKFLFFGVGGFAGQPTPIDVPPFNKGLERGYATGSTDTGHRGASLEDATWALNNPGGLVDYFEDGVELSAQAMKSLVAAYYGGAPAHSYFEGCSAGGRQAMVEAERFPTTFDGVISEAPAWNYSQLLSSFVLNAQEILRSPDAWIPPEKFVAIDKAVLEQCDGLDGVKDGIVMDPRRCRLNLSVLRCKDKADRADCLTDAQLVTLERITHPRYAKPGNGYFGFYLTGTDRSEGWWGWPEWIFGTSKPLRDASGQLNFAGDVLPKGADHGVGPNQFLLGEQFFRYAVANDPAYDARKFRLPDDYDRMMRELGHIIDANDTDLGRFIRAGGKLIIWHGWSDNAIPPDMSIDLYDRIRRDTKDHPGQTSVDQAVSLFMVPGVQHCGSGSGLTLFDALPALEAWVESGKAPARIPATQLVNGRPARSRPLCRYPKVAKYRGSGDPDAESSFDCE